MRRPFSPRLDLITPSHAIPRVFTTPWTGIEPAKLSSADKSPPPTGSGPNLANLERALTFFDFEDFKLVARLDIVRILQNNAAF